MWISVEEFKSNVLTVFLIIGLIFGVLFYDYIYIKLGFSYIDELMALFFVLFTFFLIIRTRQGLTEKYWLYLFLIFGFYLVYSFHIKSNYASAILQDFAVQIKPYLGFFCAYTIAPVFTEKQKDILRKTCFFSFFCLIVISFDMWNIMGHASRFATATICTATLFLFSSEYNKKNILIFILMLALGIFSGRSKAYGFFVISAGLVLAYYYNFSFKISIKTISIIFLLLFISLYLTWDKIYFYFIYGTQNIDANEIGEAFARPVLYIKSKEILMDYFLLGSGFASYATYFSGVYYSKIYEYYGIDNIYGLSEDYPDFIADTFYPSLVQFGIIGITLFVLFWRFIYRRSVIYKSDKKNYFLSLIIIIFFIIESIADSTFIHNRGLFIMILLGIVVSTSKQFSLNMENTDD